VNAALLPEAVDFERDGEGFNARGSTTSGASS